MAGAQADHHRRWTDDHSGAAPGPHSLKVALSERNPMVTSDVVLTDAELVVIYGQA